MSPGLYSLSLMWADVSHVISAVGLLEWPLSVQPSLLVGPSLLLASLRASLVSCCETAGRNIELA